jgi:RimJ/RimL family protein N-acetyltransferase
MTAQTPPATAWIRSRRIALREFGPADHEAIMQMHRDTRLRSQLVDDYPLDEPAVAQTFLERMAPIYRLYEGLGIWHASLIGTQPRFAGWFSLMPMTERPGQVEIGSRLLPQVWGCGLAMEGCELLLAHAFESRGLTSVWGTCHPDNRSAEVVLLALGFTPLGVQPYDRSQASHFRIDLNAWRAARNTPGGTRIRRALRARAARPAVTIPLPNEEQHA